ncbi:MAG: hypothetical protein KA138_06125 [Saprospiraceae bacterium]|nr:hypothetical protein [Saprospiraceae bacterium]
MATFTNHPVKTLGWKRWNSRSLLALFMIGIRASILNATLQMPQPE